MNTMLPTRCLWLNCKFEGRCKLKTNGWGMFACKIEKKYGRGYPDRRRVPFYNFPLVFRKVQGRMRKKDDGGILSNMDEDEDEHEHKQEEKQDGDEDLIMDKDMDEG